MRRNGLSRRIALFVIVSLAAAACGGGGGGGGGKRAEEAVKADPNGVVKIGTSLIATGGQFFDLTFAVNTPGIWTYPVYEPLLRLNADGTVGPGLAKSATIVDPSTLKVELRPN